MTQREVVLTIIGMALVTYLTRSSGFFFLSRLKGIPPRVEAWMRHLPGAILLALVTPLLLAQGVIGIGAGVVVVMVAVRTKQLLPAMVAGVVCAGIGQFFLR
jgi:uncharacterized membrane protein